MDKRLKSLQELGFVLCIDSEEREYWEQLVSRVEQVFDQDHPLTVVVKNVERKWELVSAYQKTVRRGDTQLALHLASAMVSMSDDWQYMWRRMGTTATEDVGGGDELVMKFVLAASACFPPASLHTNSLHGLWKVLTELMCNAQKGREFCQYSILKDCIYSKEKTFACFNTEYGLHIRKALTTPLKETFHGHDSQWLIANNWRGEGMAVGPLQRRLVKPLPHPTGEKAPEFQTLSGLPSYAYDMHTRTGKISLTRLCGKQRIKDFFSKVDVQDKPKTLGWALFFEEGGKIDNRLGDLQLDEFEQVAVAEKMGLHLHQWYEIRQIVGELVKNGELNEIRESVLHKAGY